MGSVTTNTDELVVVGKYTQNKQGKLKAKIVKASHDGHYIRTLAVHNRKGGTITIIVTSRKESQHRSKH